MSRSLGIVEKKLYESHLIFFCDGITIVRRANIWKRRQDRRVV